MEMIVEKSSKIICQHENELTDWQGARTHSPYHYTVVVFVINYYHTSILK
jgi:hypothetical protein